MWMTCIHRQFSMGVRRLTCRNVTALLLAVNLILAVYTLPKLLKNDKHGDSIAAESTTAMRQYRARYDTMVPPHDRSMNYEDNDHEYMYLLQAREGCSEDDPFLLIAVCSAFHHFDLRDAIRETWASVIRKHKLSTKLIFMLGAPSNEYQHLQSLAKKENAQYGDTVQETFIDTYVNLTEKTIGVLKWCLNFCPGVQFLVKADDDVFINVVNLLNTLFDMVTRKGYNNEKFMMGYVIKNADPLSDRNSKWYVPKSLFKDEKYPHYLSGSAYVISGNVVEDMYSAATSRAAFWLEDIFITGMLSRDLNIPLIHMDTFTYKKPRILQACFAKSIISTHEMSVLDLHKVWRLLHDTDQDCTDYHKHRVNKRSWEITV